MKQKMSDQGKKVGGTKTHYPPNIMMGYDFNKFNMMNYQSDMMYTQGIFDKLKQMNFPPESYRMNGNNLSN